VLPLPFGTGYGRGEPVVICRITTSGVTRGLKTIDVIDQLFDVHGNGNPFGDAAGQRTGSAALAIRAASVSLNCFSPSKRLIGGSIVALSMTASPASKVTISHALYHAQFERILSNLVRLSIGS
jgi:hypothetical protein